MKLNKEVRLTQGCQPDMSVEVAIVGGGVSGLYSAYRLTHSQALPADQVQIFEMSNRIGGRLESVVMPGMDVVGELGGMRYLTSQEIVTALIEKVFAEEMTPVPFPMGKTDKLFIYLRKQRLMQDAWEVAQKKGETQPTRYVLNENDEGYNADQLFNKIIYDVLMADPNLDNKFRKKIIYNPEHRYTYTFELTSEDWDEIKPVLTYCFEGSPYNKRKVNDIGFWNLIKDRVSQEGYNFLANAGGYYSNTINWNAAEAFPYMVGDFSANVEYKTIAEGYDQIAYSLANAYLGQEGSNIWVENKLVTFTKEHKNKSTHQYELTFLHIPSNTVWKVYANSIILAMPRKSLELLDQNNFFFNINQNAELNKNIRSVIMEPAFKILMGFDSPWWKKKFDIDSGHSITDLPMRQCYYFGTDPHNDNSLLLGSYGDMETETFWKALSDDKELFKVRANRSASMDELNALESVQATQMMVDELMNQIRELHGDSTIPDPYVTWFRDWTDDPYGAGYHAWKAGYNVKYVMEFMRKPMEAENIHICGEAYSDQQGWVEGAFCVAELMLQQYFGLERPEWIPQSYYMGW